jgi:hypothetical protein
MSVKKCASLLKKDPISIYRAIYQKRIRAYQHKNKRWVIKWSDVEKFIGQKQIRRINRKGGKKNVKNTARVDG